MELIKQTGIAKVFDYLDPSSSTGWPTDKIADQVAGKYALGHTASNNTADFSDTRETTAQVYHLSRFYVGYLTTTQTYEVQKSYLCDASASPTYASTVPITLAPSVITRVFEDGVWMTENLRAILTPTGASIVQATGVAASGSTTVPQYAYPTNNVGNRAGYGVLYNFVAATNTAKSAVIADEGGLTEGSQTQGICPAGWHVPSDRQWTDVENAIIRKTSLFSSTSDIGGTPLPYTSTGYRGTHNNPMRTGGTSNSAATGGFAGVLPGYILEDVVSSGLGANGDYWTSSVNSTNAWYRGINTSVSTVNRSTYTSKYLFSVRCKRDTAL